MLLARTLIVTLTLSILWTPLAAEAQLPGRVPRIGVLSLGSRSPPLFDAFRQGLRDLGYVEGQNIAVEYRWAEGRPERLPGLAVELVGLNVDAIVAVGGLAAQAAKNATGTVPIVFITVADAVAQGFVASLARPGGNITGLTTTTDLAIYGKMLELVKEAVPKVTRVAVLSNPASLYSALALRETEVVARTLRVQLQPLEARGPDEFDSAFATMTRERPDALLVLPDSLFVVHRTRLADLVARSRLPAIFGQKEHVDAGGLMAYGASLRDLFRRGATFVVRIVRGAKPADLPVEQPTKFELVINLKTAKALGLTIPQSILIRADRVIE